LSKEVITARLIVGCSADLHDGVAPADRARRRAAKRSTCGIAGAARRLGSDRHQSSIHLDIDIQLEDPLMNFTDSLSVYTRRRDVRGILPMVVLLGASLGCRKAPERFYATAEGGTKIIQIEVQGDHQISTKVVGPTGSVGCASLALSASGTLYSMCGPGVAAPGPQQLSIIDTQTGHANPVGSTVSGLTVMGLEFSSDGTLYAAGDSDPKSPTFNSLYVVDVKTGAFTRLGSTGAPAFFMDFAFDRIGTLYGATSLALYNIDVKTAKAAKVADFTGSNAIMGLAFNRDATKLYATDFKTPISDLFFVDAHSGTLTRVAPTGYANSHNLVLIRE
jgi:hypothetical protein